MANTKANVVAIMAPYTMPCKKKKVLVKKEKKKGLQKGQKGRGPALHSIKLGPALTLSFPSWPIHSFYVSKPLFGYTVFTVFTETASMLHSFLLAVFAAVATGSPLASLERRQTPAQIYTTCTAANVVALTFDDGPLGFTGQALDLLNAASFKATFFVNGDNWGKIADYSSVIQRMVNEGHEFGSHTYVWPCYPIPHSNS